ncbi:MAG: PAS domain S-box protein [Bacteroidales bacterium]|nr:PAS domain S-box protein [Bacteroidales bacterium]
MEFKLEELIDIVLMQDLQEKLNEIYSFPSAIVDNEGKVLTAVAWQDICTKFHRKNPESEKVCIKSDKYILEHMPEANSFVSYQCPLGLIDNAIPIVIDGKHLGNFFTGQFFLEKPDLERFKKQAKKYGFNEKEYLKAVQEVPIWTKEKLHKYLDFIKGFIEIIAGIGLRQLKEIQANKLIMDREEQHKAILQSAMDGFWIADPDGRILEVNDTYCRMSGYSQNELLSMRIFDLDAMEKPSETAERMQKNKSLGEARFESIHRRKNGSTFYVEISVQYREVNGGQFVIFLRDISDRKHIEQELKSERDQAQQFLDIAGVMICALNTGGEITMINKKGSQILGFDSPHDIIGLNWMEVFLADENRTDIRDVFYKLIGGELESLEYFENPVITKTGKKRIIAFHNNILYNQKNQVTGILFSGEDITDRRIAEEKLKESERDNRQLIQHLSSGVVVHAPDSSILSANKAASEMLGLSVDQLQGKVAKDNTWFFVGRDGTRLPVNKYPVMLTLSTGKPLENYVLGINRQDKNSIVWVLVNAFPEFDDAEQLIKAVITFADITKMVQAEDKLRESKQIIEGIINTIPARVFWKDRNLKYLGCNEDFAKDAGFSDPKEIIGKDDFQMEWHKLAEMYRSDDMEVINSGNPKLNIEEPQTNAEGRTIELLTNKIPLKNSKGEITGVLGTYMDITERKKAETALRESEERFTLAMKASNDGLFDLNLVTNEIYYSPGWKKMLGYDDHELPNDISTWENLTKPEDVKKSREQQPKLISREIDRFVTEFKMKHKDGHWIDILSHAEAFFDESGKAVRIVGTHKDITQRKLVEEKIREKDIQFRKLSANVPDLIYQFTRKPDGSYCVPIASEGIKNIFGCSPEDVLDDFAPIARVIYPEDAERVIADIEYSADHLTYFTCEFRVKIPGKEIQWILSRSTPEKLPDGSITWYGFNVDITERKKAEEALLRSETELKKAQQITRIGSWYLDLATNEVVWSEELYKMYGFDPSLPPPPYTEHQKLFTPESWDILSSSLARAAETGIPYELELKTIRKDGSNGWMWVMGETVTDNRGKLIGLWGAAQDISERKRTEQELQIARILAEQSEQKLGLKNLQYEAANQELKFANEELSKAMEKAEMADRLKSAFLANMSHEIRTPMNGILGFADLLKEPGLNGEQQQKYINIIEKSGLRMLNIINDIIDISKIEAGLMEISIVETNVNEQLDFLYNFFKHEAESKGLQFSLKNNLPDKRMVIHTDSEKLYAILTNLVKNAIKYTNQGSIELGCGMAAVTMEHAPLSLQFYVKDTGSGIARDRQEAIFDRFVQADIEDKNALQGAGLGLSITKAYVEMLGGKIWLESDRENAKNLNPDESVKGGTTFYFTIPTDFKPIQKIKETTETIPVENSPMPAKKLSPFTLLVAEDDEYSELLLKVGLQKLFKKIISVDNGADAVETCRKNPDIDIILMDIRLPVMSGFEATKQIRKFNKNIIIIAQTAYGLSGDNEKALAAGCNDYISKPINMKRLTSIVETQLLNKTNN